ncbi:hypothetical protein [Borrelia sp. P9F1]|uniref:hypothetical protein n=1 Tax=Borrelia sp. P9F1 TaxID=3058374 RepID=UPI0026480F88|nr:hypothetical protein [Borrelia sp. P9F1]WKC57936.1 hypothetical protein QYZ68_01895 [Borrelia sp. P9F1]
MSVFDLCAFSSGDTNVYAGAGVGVDNFSPDLYFYERLKYQIMSGFGVVVSDRLAFGGELSADARLLSSYTPYTREAVHMLTGANDIKELIRSPDNFDLRDISVSARVYLNYFFVPNMAIFSLTAFSGLKVGYLDFRSYSYGHIDYVESINPFIVGLDVGTRINLGFIFLEYTIAPIFHNKSLLFNQMHRVTVGLIYQENIGSIRSLDF